MPYIWSREPTVTLSHTPAKAKEAVRHIDETKTPMEPQSMGNQISLLSGSQGTPDMMPAEYQREKMTLHARTNGRWLKLEEQLSNRCQADFKATFRRIGLEFCSQADVTTAQEILRDDIVSKGDEQTKKE